MPCLALAEEGAVSKIINIIVIIIIIIITIIINLAHAMLNPQATVIDNIITIILSLLTLMITIANTNNILYRSINGVHANTCPCHHIFASINISFFVGGEDLHPETTDTK